MPNLEIIRFHGSPFSGSTRSRGTLLQEADKYGEQAIKQFVGEFLQMRTHESNTKRAGLMMRRSGVYLEVPDFQIIRLRFTT